MTLAWTSASSSSGSPYRVPEVFFPQVLTPDGRSLPLVSAKLRVDAGAGLARVVLEQTFENPFPETLRVTYKMPLPVDGAVSGYAFRIGSRKITGKVDRKEAARARFEEAIVQGKTAALLEQNKADIFTQEIGNLPAGATIVAEITIDQRLAWKPEGEWELRFPTVIGPRYIGAHVAPADAKDSHVELANGGVRARAHLELRIADAITEGRRAESPSHRLTTRADGVIELLDAEGGKLDRDVVVRWPVATLDVGLAVSVARADSSEANGRNAYALLSIVPPAADAGYAAVPRDLIVLLDTSGSMGGPPLEQAKRIVASLIDSLSEQDRLEVVEFSTRPNRYTKQPVPGTKREKENAIHWVMNRQANGGTEMRSAIIDALKGLRSGAQRQVVLVTDGYVGGEEEIVTLLHESLPASCRMHVVGVGSAVNRNLAASLARAGRGAEVLVGLDEDPERFAKSLVDKTRAPVLTDLVIGGDALVEHAPEHLPDVFAGAPVLAALQVKPTGGEIIVRGNLARGTWEQRIQVPAAQPGTGNQAVVKLYGRERVADLEMRWTIGKEVHAIDREIESIGLVFQIATRRTSWLAIDDDRTIDPRLGYRQEEIPQELPYGTTMASFGGAPVMVLAMTAPSMVAMPRPMPMPMPMPSPSRAAVRGAFGGAPPAVRSRVTQTPAPEQAKEEDSTRTGGRGADMDEDEMTDAARTTVRAPAAPPFPSAPARGEPTTLRALPAPVAAEAAPPAAPPSEIEVGSLATPKAVETRARLPRPVAKRRRWLLIAAILLLLTLATLAWLWLSLSR